QVPCTDVRIVKPVPLAEFLIPFFVAFQSGAAHHAVGGDVFLTAPQSWQLFDLHLWLVIVLVYKVAHCPEQTRRDNLWLGFRTKFDFPSHALFIFDQEFWIGSIHIFLKKRQSPVRLTLFATGSVKQIARLDVDRLKPERGLRGLHTN